MSPLPRARERRASSSERRALAMPREFCMASWYTRSSRPTHASVTIMLERP